MNRNFEKTLQWQGVIRSLQPLLITPFHPPPNISKFSGYFTKITMYLLVLQNLSALVTRRTC